LYVVFGASIVLWRHRENVRSLIKGTERKVGEGAVREDARVR
jgi:glycerol-3-phosphate acyltransferase PlsY